MRAWEITKDYQTLPFSFHLLAPDGERGIRGSEERHLAEARS